jgi:hypothetical protein
MLRAILDWLAHRWNDMIDYLWRLVLSLYDMLKDFFMWIMESLLAIGVFLLDGVGYMLDGLDIAQFFAFIPPETAYMLNITGVSQGMGMIVTCLGIRFILQMIPFVRWGS